MPFQPTKLQRPGESASDAAAQMPVSPLARSGWGTGLTAALGNPPLRSGNRREGDASIVSGGSFSNNPSFGSSQATPKRANTDGSDKIFAERFRTKLCRNYDEKGSCPYESRCMFAHGEQQLRTTEMNLRDGLTDVEAIRQFKQRSEPEAQVTETRELPTTVLVARSPAAVSIGITPDSPKTPKISVMRPVAAVSVTPQILRDRRSDDIDATNSHPRSSHDISLAGRSDAILLGAGGKNTTPQLEAFPATPPRDSPPSEDGDGSCSATSDRLTERMVTPLYANEAEGETEPFGLSSTSTAPAPGSTSSPFTAPPLRLTANTLIAEAPGHPRTSSTYRWNPYRWNPIVIEESNS